jgi:hypothetical protein
MHIYLVACNHFILKVSRGIVQRLTNTCPFSLSHWNLERGNKRTRTKRGEAGFVEEFLENQQPKTSTFHFIPNVLNQIVPIGITQDRSKQ